jgi:hypothetical protein
VENRTSASYSWVHILYVAALVVSLIVLIVGINIAFHTHSYALLAAGCAGIVGVLIGWPITTVLCGAYRNDFAHQTELLTTLADRLQQISVLLNLIGEQQLISDRAKSVAFREKDRDALRRAINEEMAKKDWEAALALADEIERQFGYKQEADNLRDQINNRRQDVIRKQVTDAVAVIDRHTKAEQWTMAHREAERLMRLFPQDPQVMKLPEEIESRRNAFKRQLLENWNESVLRHDTEGAIEILKKLDLYLTPTEAVAMQDTVRGVFKEQLTSLRAQFATAVQEHKWTDAVKVGEQVIKEFPNSRTAQEVREKMDTLRQRATEVPAVANA